MRHFIVKVSLEVYVQANDESHAKFLASELTEEDYLNKLIDRRFGKIIESGVTGEFIEVDGFGNDITRKE